MKKSSKYFRQEHRVLCAQKRTCQKVDEDFLKQMWSNLIIQTLKTKKVLFLKKNIFLAVVSLNMPREVQKMALAVLIFSEGFERTYIKVH